MNKETYEKNAVRYIGGRQPVSNAKFLIYRTFYIENGIRHISHIHCPMNAGALNWSLKLDIGNIFDYLLVNAPKFKFKGNAKI